MFGDLMKALILILFMPVVGCDSGTSYYFSNFKEIKKDKTVLGASAPDFLPSSATDIFGWFHVEMDQESIEFSYVSQEKQQMILSFVGVRREEMRAIQKEFLERHWKKVNKDSSFEYFTRSGVGELEYLVLDVVSNRAYYWSRIKGV